MADTSDALNPVLVPSNFAVKSLDLLQPSPKSTLIYVFTQRESVSRSSCGPWNQQDVGANRKSRRMFAGMERA